MRDAGAEPPDEAPGAAEAGANDVTGALEAPDEQATTIARRPVRTARTPPNRVRAIGVERVVAIGAIGLAPPIAALDAVSIIIQFVVYPMSVVDVGIVTAARIVVRSTAGAIDVIDVDSVVAIIVLPGVSLVAISIICIALVVISTIAELIEVAE